MICVHEYVTPSLNVSHFLDKISDVYYGIALAQTKTFMIKSWPKSVYYIGHW